MRSTAYYPSGKTNTTCDDGNRAEGFPLPCFCVSKFTLLVVALFTLMPANCAEMCLNLRRN